MDKETAGHQGHEQKTNFKKSAKDYHVHTEEQKPDFTDIPGFEAHRAARGVTGEYSPNVERVMGLTDILWKFEHKHESVTEGDAIFCLWAVKEGVKDDTDKLMLGGTMQGCQDDIVSLLVNFMMKNPRFAESIEHAVRVHRQMNLGSMFEHLAKIFKP